MSQNVLLVTVDSVRADHCGFLGSGDDLTPTLDGLAEDAVVFERAIAPGPRTPSSMPVVFTGEFVAPGNLGVYENYDEKRTRWMERQDRIRRHVERFRTIPERFHELGYDTGGVTANPWTTENTGFDAGFDVFEAVHDSDGVEPRSFPVASAVANTLDGDVDEWLLTWEDFYDVVLETREQLSEPYFLWVFLLDPHQPYLAPRRHREENTALGMYYGNLRYNRSFGYTDDLPAHLDARLQRAYRDTIRSVDAFVDRLRTDLATDEPALVFHADHGEAFGDHGAYGHRLQLYRENVHVPLLVHGTGQAGRFDQPVALRDLGTALDALARPDESLDPAALSRPFVVSRTEEGERVGIRDESWSYVAADPSFEEYLHDYQPEELYDLERDPGERANVAGERSRVTEAFRTRLSGHEAHRRECELLAEAAEELADAI